MTSPARRLLVVDDDPQMGTFISRAAEECGFAVQVAYDTRDLLERCRAWPPTIVVLDLLMPTVDGIEVLGLLAESESTASILLISGFDTKVLGAAQRLGTARGLAMIGTLTKPIRAAELRAALNNALPP
jgi:DNA-binding response OmpR family regulator